VEKTRLKTESRDVHLSQGIQQGIEDANAKEQCQTLGFEKAKGGKPFIYHPR